MSSGENNTFYTIESFESILGEFGSFTKRFHSAGSVLFWSNSSNPTRDTDRQRRFTHESSDSTALAATSTSNISYHLTREFLLPSDPASRVGARELEAGGKYQELNGTSAETMRWLGMRTCRTGAWSGRHCLHKTSEEETMMIDGWYLSRRCRSLIHPRLFIFSYHLSWRPTL